MAVALTIVTPSGEAFRGDVDTVLLPGSEGDFGVLENHERFLTPLRIGGIEIDRAGEILFAAIGQGFAEVGADGVTVLVDSCDLADEMCQGRLISFLEGGYDLDALADSVEAHAAALF